MKQQTMLLNFIMIILQWYQNAAKHKASKETGLKRLTPKQMFQRLPIALS